MVGNSLKTTVLYSSLQRPGISTGQHMRSTQRTSLHGEQNLVFLNTPEKLSLLGDPSTSSASSVTKPSFQNLTGCAQ